MKTVCPHCNFEYPEIDDSLLDKEVECAECGEIFVVDKVKFDRQIDFIPQKKSNANTTGIDKSKLTDCPACGNLVSKKAQTCPKCGEKIMLGKCRNKKLGWLFFAGALICIFIALIGGYIEDQNGDRTLLACGIVGLIVALLGIAVCFTSPSGR